MSLSRSHSGEEKTADYRTNFCLHDFRQDAADGMRLLNT